MNAKNRRPCDFCDFSQVHEKSQISQLRANLDISAVNDRIWKHCKNQARRLVSKICVQFDARKKQKLIKLCSTSRMVFRAWFYKTDPQNIGGQFGTLLGFLRNTFRNWTSQKKKPRSIFQTEKSQDYFEKRTPVYSLVAPLLGLYINSCSSCKVNQDTSLVN